MCSVRCAQVLGFLLGSAPMEHQLSLGNGMGFVQLQTLYVQLSLWHQDVQAGRETSDPKLSGSRGS